MAFQFTLPRGERQKAMDKGLFEIKFQFTLPRGERLAHPILCILWRCFNSRSREGSDIKMPWYVVIREKRFNSRSREGSDHASEP